jgi:hypothetical protein
MLRRSVTQIILVKSDEHLVSSAIRTVVTLEDVCAARFVGGAKHPCPRFDLFKPDVLAYYDDFFPWKDKNLIRGVGMKRDPFTFFPERPHFITRRLLKFWFPLYQQFSVGSRHAAALNGAACEKCRRAV